MDGRVFFRGTGDGQAQGIYVHDGADVSVIVDRTTPIPGGTGTFTSFWFLKAGPSGMVFVGKGSSGQVGIYRHDGTAVRVVADTATPIPGGSGTFQGFSTLPDPDVFFPRFLVTNDTVVFFGTGAGGQDGIYADFRGDLRKIVDATDSLDGRAIFSVRLDSERIVNRAFLVRADFDVLFPSALFRVDIGTETRAAVLPSSRSVQIGTPATAFATIVNPGPRSAVGCRITPAAPLPRTSCFRPRTPPRIKSPGHRTRRWTFRRGPARPSSSPSHPPSRSLPPTCSSGSTARTVIWRRCSPAPTLFFSASATPVPDIVALAATLDHDGVVKIPGAPGTGVFAVATVNGGAGGRVPHRRTRGAPVCRFV